MRSCRRAFTLIEALVTMAVFLLILTFIGSLMSFGVQSYLRQNSQADAQRTMLVGTGTLSDKLRLSAESSATVYYPSGSPAGGDLHFSMALPMDMQRRLVRDAAGLPVYQSYWIYYRRNPVKALYQTDLALAAPSTTPPPPLSSAEIEAAIMARPGHKVIDEVATFMALSLHSDTPVSTPQTAMRLRLGLVPRRAEPFNYTFCLRFMR